ncbi:MAG: hypothetical protein M0Z52_12510 [Actinomycetota bacterium]|nr:hypothetical protein [Actinomycetota bacterium]
MDRFVKRFIFMSITYLLAASIIGVMMLGNPKYLGLKFVHSHLMLLGWVSMMIYGVGYHILPRFAGKALKSKTLAEIQFWLANAGLIGMLGFYTSAYYTGTGAYMRVSALFGAIEVASIALFVYNMMTSLYGKS